MARPPRIPVMLPWDCRVIYFLTLCVVPRCNALDNEAAWRAFGQTLKRLNKWNTYCVLMMPDHVHLLTAPLERDLSVAAFLKWLKRWFNDVYELPEKCEWQPGGFDRLLRTSESIHEKWQNIREYPVRAGLVEALETVAIQLRVFRRRKRCNDFDGGDAALKRFFPKENS